MIADRIAQLTDTQRQCLRLVRKGYQSKEIAALLGRSRHTVDGHVRDALQTLGVGQRHIAARLLADHETPPQPLIAASLRMGERQSEVVADATSITDWFADRDQGDGAFQGSADDAAGHTVADPSAQSMKERRRNSLTIPERLAWIASATTRFTVFVAALMFAIYLFQRVFQSLHDQN